MSFTVKGNESYRLDEIFEAVERLHPEMVMDVRTNHSKVSIIGSGMRDMTGVASRAFMALQQAGIPFYQTTTSEISISYVVDGEKDRQAVEVLAKKFNL